MQDSSFFFYGNKYGGRQSKKATWSFGPQIPSIVGLAHTCNKSRKTFMIMTFMNINKSEGKRMEKNRPINKFLELNTIFHVVFLKGKKRGK